MQLLSYTFYPARVLVVNVLVKTDLDHLRYPQTDFNIQLYLLSLPFPKCFSLPP